MRSDEHITTNNFIFKRHINSDKKYNRFGIKS